jgi:hypothetical protein
MTRRISWTIRSTKADFVSLDSRLKLNDWCAGRHIDYNVEIVIIIIIIIIIIIMVGWIV